MASGRPTWLSFWRRLRTWVRTSSAVPTPAVVPQTLSSRRSSDMSSGRRSYRASSRRNSIRVSAASSPSTRARAPQGVQREPEAPRCCRTCQRFNQPAAVPAARAASRARLASVAPIPRTRRSVPAVRLASRPNDVSSTSMTCQLTFEARLSAASGRSSTRVVWPSPCRAALQASRRALIAEGKQDGGHGAVSSSVQDRPGRYLIAHLAGRAQGAFDEALEVRVGLAADVHVPRAAAVESKRRAAFSRR